LVWWLTLTPAQHEKNLEIQNDISDTTDISDETNKLEQKVTPKRVLAAPARIHVRQQLTFTISGENEKNQTTIQACFSYQFVASADLLANA
jgi:hypothetical protein